MPTASSEGSYDLARGSSGPDEAPSPSVDDIAASESKGGPSSTQYPVESDAGSDHQTTEISDFINEVFEASGHQPPVTVVSTPAVTEAPSKVPCVQCGEKMKAGGKFCPHCGAKQG